MTEANHARAKQENIPRTGGKDIRLSPKSANFVYSDQTATMSASAIRAGEIKTKSVHPTEIMVNSQRRSLSRSEMGVQFLPVKVADEYS